MTARYTLRHHDSTYQNHPGQQWLALLYVAKREELPVFLEEPLIAPAVVASFPINHAVFSSSPTPL